MTLICNVALYTPLVILKTKSHLFICLLGGIHFVAATVP